MIGSESTSFVRHTSAEGTTILAKTVHMADTPVARAVGLIGRRGLKEGHALVFPFERRRTRRIHTVGVRAAIDVVWCVGDRVRSVRTLPAWRGLASAPADTVVELPAGAAGIVEVGDRLCVV